MGDLPTGVRGLILVLSVPGLYCLMLLLGRRLKRRQGVQLGWPYHFFSLCLTIFLPAKLFDLRLPFRRELGAVTVVLGAAFVIALIDRYVWDLYFRQKHRVKLPKFVAQVAALTILVLAVFLVLEVGYNLGLEIKSLLIAPGILAVILGLAMQDLLGNIIAGLALQFGNAFKDGDWLFVDNKYAEVIDINWRSTRLRTLDDISVDIPNRDLAKQVIINLNQPARRHAMRVSVCVDYSAAPTRVKDVLLHATNNAKGVAPEPHPKVFLKAFGDSAIEYEIKFWMDDHSQYNDICDAVRTNAWYGLQRHGIRIPFPIRTVQLERPGRNRQQDMQTAARISLRQQPLFKCLSDAQLDALLPRGRLTHFGRGEKLIQQGENGDSMFILVEGEANVVVERNGSSTLVANLRAGDCFGEMSLLTGERRSATVFAHTDCEVVEIGKPVLAHSLKANPELLNKLSELLAQRQMATEGILSKTMETNLIVARQTEYTATFIDTLKLFFEL